MGGYRHGWHRDFAAESIKQYELNQWCTDPSFTWTKYAIECGEVVKLAQQVGHTTENQKIVSIAETVLDTIKQSVHEGIRCRRRITDKQQHTLAVALLEQYGNARAIATAVWGLTNEEIDNADA